MIATNVGRISEGQDGAIFGNYLFRFDAKGVCSVHRPDAVSGSSLPISRFSLGETAGISPHSNSVAFGAERYLQEDEFPLLYSNIFIPSF